MLLQNIPAYDNGRTRCEWAVLIRHCLQVSAQALTTHYKHTDFLLKPQLAWGSTATIPGSKGLKQQRGHCHGEAWGAGITNCPAGATARARIPSEEELCRHTVVMLLPPTCSSLYDLRQNPQDTEKQYWPGWHTGGSKTRCAQLFSRYFLLWISPRMFFQYCLEVSAWHLHKDLAFLQSTLLALYFTWKCKNSGLEGTTNLQTHWKLIF